MDAKRFSHLCLSMQTPCASFNYLENSSCRVSVTIFILCLSNISRPLVVLEILTGGLIESFSLLSIDVKISLRKNLKISFAYNFGSAPARVLWQLLLKGFNDDVTRANKYH